MNNSVTVKDLISAVNPCVLCEGDLSKAVTGCYCGDLLSWVMSRAKSGDAWLTVMGNVNAIGVAALADLACIILTEDAALDAPALERASQQGITVLRTGENSYEVACKISKLI